MIATSRRVLLVAKVVIHLDLEPGLEHLLGQAGQQPARTDEIDPVSTRPVNQLLGQRPVRPLLIVVLGWLRHHHILLSHDLSFPANEPLTVSGQTSYTADPTVPRAATPGDAPRAASLRSAATKWRLGGG
jgi:hypothetical protein